MLKKAIIYLFRNSDLFHFHNVTGIYSVISSFLLWLYPSSRLTLTWWALCGLLPWQRAIFDKGFAYSERLWIFCEWKPCNENNFNIFSMPIFFILSEIEEFLFGLKDFQLYTVWRWPLLGHIMLSILLAPTVSQAKWPKQLDFWTNQLQWPSVARRRSYLFVSCPEQL